MGAGVEDLFHHVLAVSARPGVSHEVQRGRIYALMEWPRIPLPGWPDGSEGGAAEALSESAAHGRRDSPAAGHRKRTRRASASGPLRPEIAAIAVPSTTSDHRNMAGPDFNLDAGWGHFGREPGGHARPGPRDPPRLHIGRTRRPLQRHTRPRSQTTFDIYLNDRAYWKNIPAAVWNYKLGGYQVLKKWLSYRERRVLGRALRPEEVAAFHAIWGGGWVGCLMEVNQ